MNDNGSDVGDCVNTCDIIIIDIFANGCAVHDVPV